jgi:hypothetical protein
MTNSNRIIIVRLIGGLGNQLFQLQFALSLQHRLGGKLLVDDSFLASSSKTHEILAVQSLIETLPRTRLSWFDLKVRRTIERVVHKIGLNFPRSINSLYLFENSRADLAPMRRIIVDGFWQDSSHFNLSFAETLRLKLFEVYPKALNSQSVCVHIRRGDYLTNRSWFFKNQIVIPLDYYLEAFDYFRSAIDSPLFEVYTDDEAWALKTFELMPDVKVIASEDLVPFVLLAQMASYQNFIIANSTLSWWAAAVSEESQKKVILPLSWGKGIFSKKYQLDNWIAI